MNYKQVWYKIKNLSIKQWVLFLSIGFIGLWIGFTILIWIISFSLPDIKDIGNISLDESTTILDSKGDTLYKVHDEIRRTFVSIDEVSPHFLDALISIEDENFYTHGGVSVFSTINGTLLNFLRGQRIRGGSTITQQLAKNAFLDASRTLTRKIREWVLAYRLESIYTKREILELYINYISFGKVYGIEEASQLIFNKKSKDLDILESSILASLPAGTTTYSPFKNKKALMGYCKSDNALDEALSEVSKSIKIEINATKKDVWVQYTLDGKDTSQLIKAGNKKIIEAYQEFSGYFGHTDFDLLVNDKIINNKDRSVRINNDFLKENNVEAVSAEDTNTCESAFDPNYVKGRKDLVLQRMYELGYITQEEMDSAWKEGLSVSFSEADKGIKAPHFVFYIIDELEQKFGKDLVEKGGLQVKTTLDMDLQKIAEENVYSYIDTNKTKTGARNGALLSIEPATGKILSMVGSKEYFNEEIDGKVNIITSPRQPGSSFKPIVYASAFSRGELTPGSVLWDTPITIGGKDSPNNFDGLFMGPISVRTALGHSRNIPAAKAYFFAGEESYILNFVESFGVGELTQYKQKMIDRYGGNFSFGWPLALGAGEIRPIDLASLYSVFANNGNKVPLYGIEEVTDSKGNILYKHDEAQGYRVLDPRVAYMVSQVLSDNNSRPSAWNTAMSIPGKIIATKTGTSNKKENGKNIANNAWIIGYTPSVLTLVWGGNSDGSALSPGATGYSVVGGIWNSYMRKAIGSKTETFEIPSGMVWKDINVLSGKLASENTPKQFIKSELFMGDAVPTDLDDSIGYVEVDTRNNLLANNTCPSQFVESKPYLRIPDENPRFPEWTESSRQWARENPEFFLSKGLIPFPPTDTSPLCDGSNSQTTSPTNGTTTTTTTSQTPEILIKSPEANALISGNSLPIEVESSIDIPNLLLVRIFLNDKVVSSSKTLPIKTNIDVSGFKAGDSIKLTAEAIDTEANIYSKSIDLKY